MKTILFFLIITLSFTLSKAQWVELDPGVDDALYDIYAITPDIVVAVGYNGTIIKTIDGGETWQQKESGTAKGLNRIQFTSPNIGYIIGDMKTVLKTVDGGETWFSTDTTPTENFNGLFVVDENIVFIYNHYTLFKSIDGGSSWSDYTLGFFSHDGIQFFNEYKGLLSSSSGIMFTDDGGITWEQRGGYSPFHFLDENIGFYHNGGLFKTIDGGYNFTQLGGSEWIGALSYIHAVNENLVWGILGGFLDGDPSTRGIMKMTYSESDPYMEDFWYDNDPYIDMTSIHFAENTGYIVGYSHGNPTIWKNSTGVNTMSTTEPTATNEIKVYPNPASEMLNIDLGKTVSDIYISLTDMSGKQVISEKHKQKDKFSINTEKLLKGIYVLSIQANQQIFNRKIIIN